MTSAMGSPPPGRNPPDSLESEPENLPQQPTSSSSSSSSPMEDTSNKTLMGPPKNPNPNPQPHPIPREGKTDEIERIQSSLSVPYSIPEWSGSPCHHFYLEVLKDGSIINQFDVWEKGAYMFGRVDLCDFVLDHPTISRFHAVIQFKRNGDAYLYDLASTHGTFINKIQVEKKVYVQLNVGDVIRFGQSSRLYIFQGPPDLMPPEADLKSHRGAKMRQEMIDREASLLRARMEASLADGISWGMGEDAIEEAEDDADEITWQTYKGKLTEKQEKTRDKIIKRTEKISHMKKEIDAIRVKDISQGGLTQGQQTQIARNEQRIMQIMEELENLEETLNESIRESIGARAGISHGKRKGTTEEDDEFSSDDDEFYDRTKKSSVQNVGENQSVETADTLLDKRDVIMKEMDGKREVLLIEKNKMPSEPATETDVGDALDAFMSGLSSQLVLDKTAQLEKELSALQSELDRIYFLLKIADPSGEAAMKRDSKTQGPNLDKAELPVATKKQPPVESKSNEMKKPTNVSLQKEKNLDSMVSIVDSDEKHKANKIVMDAPEDKTAVYTVAKPQWLGAVNGRELQEIQQTEVLNIEDSDQFVNYKDRQKILHNVLEEEVTVNSGIESAAPGLIIRKRKETEKHEISDNGNNEQQSSSSIGAELMAEDAVALLLKHKRGYHAEDDAELYENQEKGRNQPNKDQKKPKRVIGPEKPTFLNSNSDYESWVPPEGQSGDGRTSLNDRYGY